MNPLLRRLDRLVEAFSRSPLWRSECRVWGQRMACATFDRWLYLRLHRFGWMGRTERGALARLVRPGMTVVDVGSNLGLYTVLLSRLVGSSGRVLAYEPDPGLFGLLQQNCARNACANVSLKNFALGGRRDRLVLCTLLVNSGDNHLGDGGGRLFRREVEVEVVPLDEIASGPAPDLVKIDVQGWELHVLRGMSRLLRENPQTCVYFEYWPAGFRRAGYAAADIVAFLTDLNFRLYRAETLEPLDAAALAALTGRLSGLKHADLVGARHPLHPVA